MFRRKPAGKMATAPAGWTRLNEFVRLDGTFVASGKQALKFEPQKRADLQSLVRSSAFQVTPGEKLTISGLVFSDGTEGTDFLKIVPMDDQGKFIGAKNFNAPFDSPFWHRIEAEFTVPDKANTAVIEFAMKSKQGQIWIDDLSVKDERGQELLRNGGFEQ